ncbi:hypothetical protein SMNI109538_10950 [Smaragdicoccus niigatensis]
MGCPVRRACGLYAIDLNIGFGVWAAFDVRFERAPLVAWLANGSAVA